MAGLKRPPGKARPRKVETGELARLAKALGHPARIEILRTLMPLVPPETRSGWVARITAQFPDADPRIEQRALEAVGASRLPEIVPLYTDMTTRAYLKYAARLRGVNKSRARSRVDEVVEQCGLQEYVEVTLGKLSKGFKQRVGLAQAIIHDPQILILDEPTDGLDPNQKKVVRDMIKQMSADKVIMLSTHVLEEVEAEVGALDSSWPD